MKAYSVQVQEIECYQISLKLKSCRVDAERGLEELQRSLEADGQQQPVVVCSGEGGGFVLLDGYRRLEAMNRLGRDKILAEIQPCEEAEGLLRMLGKETGRNRPALEEARLIQELVETHGTSKVEVAKRLAKSPRWVRDRLNLIQQVDPDWWESMRQGKLSTWTVNRVLLPLQQINADHAQTLVKAIERDGFSTRELETWFSHYKNSTNLSRKRMVENPKLFLQALAQKQSKKEAEEHQIGPEGDCLRDSQILLAIGRRLGNKLTRISSTAEAGILNLIENNLSQLERVLIRTKEQLEAGKHENTSQDTGRDSCDEFSGDGDQNDRQAPENLEEHGSQCDQKQGPSGAGVGKGSRTSEHRAGTVPRVQGQCRPDSRATERGPRYPDRIFDTDKADTRDLPARSPKKGREIPLRPG